MFAHSGVLRLSPQCGTNMEYAMSVSVFYGKMVTEFMGELSQVSW